MSECLGVGECERNIEVFNLFGCRVVDNGKWIWLGFMEEENLGFLKRTGKIDGPELLPFYLQVAINYRESILANFLFFSLFFFWPNTILIPTF